jgi:hypothetical protein
MPETASGQHASVFDLVSSLEYRPDLRYWKAETAVVPGRFSVRAVGRKNGGREIRTIHAPGGIYLCA